MTLTLEEMIEILEGIAREGTNAAARIAATKTLMEIAPPEPDTGPPSKAAHEALEPEPGSAAHSGRTASLGPAPARSSERARGVSLVGRHAGGRRTSHMTAFGCRRSEVARSVRTPCLPGFPPAHGPSTRSSRPRPGSCLPALEEPPVEVSHIKRLLAGGHVEAP